MPQCDQEKTDAPGVPVPPPPQPPQAAPKRATRKRPAEEGDPAAEEKPGVANKTAVNKVMKSEHGACSDSSKSRTKRFSCVRCKLKGEDRMGVTAQKV